MAKLRIPFDFSAAADIEGGVYSAVLERMVYRPEVTKEESKDGKAKSPQIGVQWKITEDGDAEGEIVFQNLYLTQKARRRAVAFFEAFGEDFDELVVDEETGVILEPNLEGIACEIKVYIDGQWGPKVDDPPHVLSSKRRAAAKSKKDDDDEDEKPKRSRRASEDDEDDEDEDDEPAPKRRGGRKLR